MTRILGQIVREREIRERRPLFVEVPEPPLAQQPQTLIQRDAKLAHLARSRKPAQKLTGGGDMGKAPFVGEPEALVIRIELHIPDFVYSRIERLDPDVQLQRSVRGIATQAPPVLIESPDAAIAGVHDEPAHSTRGNHYGDLVGARLDLPDAVLVRDPDARVGKRRRRRKRKRTQEPSRESDRRAHFPPPMHRPEARASPYIR